MTLFTVSVEWTGSDPDENGDFHWTGVAPEEGEAECRAFEAMANLMIGQRGLKDLEAIEFAEELGELIRSGGAKVTTSPLRNRAPMEIRHEP